MRRVADCYGEHLMEGRVPLYNPKSIRKIVYGTFLIKKVVVSCLESVVSGETLASARRRVVILSELVEA